MSISTEISERALNELYVKNFKRIIKKSDPWGLMCAYNRINGVYAAENKYLLKDILRDELGFTGHVVTDWGAARKATAGATGCIKAGLSLEMPGKLMGKTMAPKKVQKALNAGKISEADIDYVVLPMLRTFIRVGIIDDPKPVRQKIIDIPEHQAVAQKIAEESMVLLKNQSEILPIDLTKTKKIAILGPNARKVFGKYLQGGSSAVVPPRFITPYDGIANYIKGKAELVENPEDAEIVILVLGLDHGGSILKAIFSKEEGDTEGLDRTRYALNEEQLTLFDETIKKNLNTVVILVAGSPVDCSPFMEKASALLNAWYPGMMGGDAIARVIFGEVSPSGKLPVTYPMKLEDHPAHKSKDRFPGNRETLKIHFDEGIYVGYRYFDQNNINPMFPFGYGLSYTKFELSNVKINTPTVKGQGKFTVTVDVKNIGSIRGAEIVQVYITDDEASVERPPRELQGFDKVFLDPGETKTATIPLDQTAFEFYSEDAHAFVIESGTFTVYVGNSSRNLPLKGKIEYQQ
jgi:beta-glucosidase